MSRQLINSKELILQPKVATLNSILALTTHSSSFSFLNEKGVLYQRLGQILFNY
jgi:hypothetical protein